MLRSEFYFPENEIVDSLPIRKPDDDRREKLQLLIFLKRKINVPPRVEKMVLENIDKIPLEMLDKVVMESMLKGSNNNNKEILNNNLSNENKSNSKRNNFNKSNNLKQEHLNIDNDTLKVKTDNSNRDLNNQESNSRDNLETNKKNIISNNDINKKKNDANNEQHHVDTVKNTNKNRKQKSQKSQNIDKQNNNKNIHHFHKNIYSNKNNKKTKDKFNKIDTSNNKEKDNDKKKIKEIKVEPEKFDIDFIAREYAIHEKWEKFPTKEKNQIVTSLPIDKGKPDGKKITIPIEERKKLLTEAAVEGGLLGVGEFGAGLLLSKGLSLLGKIAVKKGLGKVVPFVGLAFSGVDLFFKLKGGILGNIGNEVKTLWSKDASEIDKKIALWSLIKDISGLFSSILGVLSGICGVIAALTSWTLVGGVSFGAAAVVLGAISAALSVVEALTGFQVANLRRQKILSMEGNPADIMKEIQAYRDDIEGATSGLLSGLKAGKDSFKEVKGLQEKYLIEGETHISEQEVKAATSKTEGALYVGDKGKLAAYGKNTSEIVDVSTSNINEEFQIVTSKSKLGGRSSLPKIEHLNYQRTEEFTKFHYEHHSGLYVDTGARGPVSGMDISHESSTFYAHSIEAESSIKAKKFGLVTEGFDPLNPRAPEKPSDGSLSAPSVGGMFQMVTGTKVSEIPDKFKKEVATDDANTTFVMENGKGYLKRTLPLTPLPVPPYKLPEVIKRLDVAARLQKKENVLKEALNFGKNVEQQLKKEQSGEGNLNQYELLYNQYNESLENQQKQIDEKSKHVKSAEELLTSMSEKDKEFATKADKALKSEEVNAVTNAVNDPFLNKVVRVGAGVAEVGAKIVNFVGGVFGKKEPVIDTRAIEKVKRLFSEAPRAKQQKSKLQGTVGKHDTHTLAKNLVDKNKSRISKTISSYKLSRKKHRRMGEVINEGKQQFKVNYQFQKMRNKQIRRQLHEVIEAKATQISQFNSEMHALNVWAVMHFNIRQANLNVIKSAHEVPDRKELTPESAKKIETMNSKMDEMISNLNNAEALIENKKKEAIGTLIKKGIHEQSAVRSLNEVANYFISNVAKKHKNTIKSMKTTLQVVNTDKISSVIESIDKTLRAINISVKRAFSKALSSIDEILQKATAGTEKKRKRVNFVHG